MRFYRVSFIVGLAVGYVLGAQAGRERYEQLKQLAHKAAENPSMQQAAGALQAQAMATAKQAREMAATGIRQGADRITHHGNSHHQSRTTTSPTAGNGMMPRGTQTDDNRPFRTD